MWCYEVIVELETTLTGAFERYMRGKHIPEIFATGCFQAIYFEQSESNRFRTRYHARGRADLDRYLEKHTARFREDFIKHFPDGVCVARSIWQELQGWY